jgi:two-component system KDP operon response regulator KdpE
MSRPSNVVVLIDQYPKIRRFFRTGFEMKGYEVLEAQNAIDGIKLATYQSPNIVIIDPNLPDLQGSEVLQKIGSQSNVPIIVLSAICAENEKVRLLPEGADDYVTKPFSMLELLARSEAALRRYFVTREVLLDQKPVGLTRKEYRLLHIWRIISVSW